MNECAEDKKLRREATAQYREKKLEVFSDLVKALQPKQTIDFLRLLLDIR